MREWLRAFRVLMTFAFQAAPREAALFLFAGVLMSLTDPAAAWGAKLLVDAALARDFQIGALGVIVLAAASGLGLINTLYYVDLLFTVAEQTGAAVDKRLIALLGGIPGLAHHEHPAYLDQLDLLREERTALAWMTNATAGIVRVLVYLVSSGLLLAAIDPLLLLLPLVGVVPFLAGRRAQIWEQAAAEATAEPERLRRQLFGIATSAAAGKELRIFRLVDELVRRHRAVADTVIGARDRAEWRGAGVQVVDSLVSGLAYVGAIGLVLLHAFAGRATAGDVVLVVGLAAGMNSMVFIAVAYGTSFLRVLRVAGRYLWLVDYAAAARPPPARAPVPERLTTGIDLQGVSFRYPETPAPVLEDISLQIPAGKVVALVGENGAGKTTLVKLLCGFYAPTGGRIMVDGADLQGFAADQWRARIAAALQDFMRFEFLAREAVGVGDLPRIADAGAVATALDRADAAGVAAGLPQGLETQLGRTWAAGVELSGGQWQKLALGRAMMRRPLLLLLDEPTASLDAQTEHALFTRYAQAARENAAGAGTITLLVSHRFSTVRMADLIVVLEGGRIREVGSHTELMAQGGLYAELYEMQARLYR